jgi:tRNA-specific 2-thiouridylase
MRARVTAETLGIPYHIIDLEQEFKTEVVDPFLDGYRRGLTPNPCIRCNRTIKFGKLVEFMKEMGCEKLATGHYARVATEDCSDGTTRRLLLEAADLTKDQSYFLYGLTQEQLSSVMFPLGALQKSDVYTLASHFNVPFDEEYRESQDLCFFPEKHPAEFLKRYLPDAMIAGNITRRDGTVVGEHSGLPLYTIGQRRGLRIGGLSIPLEVVAKKSETNELIVAEQGSEKIAGVHLENIHWVSWQPAEHESIAFECRLRSLSPRKNGILTYSGNKGVFTFSTQETSIAPGQSLVLYRGQEVVGGAVMAGRV